MFPTFLSGPDSIFIRMGSRVFWYPDARRIVSEDPPVSRGFLRIAQSLAIVTDDERRQ